MSPKNALRIRIGIYSGLHVHVHISIAPIILKYWIMILIIVTAWKFGFDRAFWGCLMDAFQIETMHCCLIRNLGFIIAEWNVLIRNAMFLSHRIFDFQVLVLPRNDRSCLQIQIQSWHKIWTPIALKRQLNNTSCRPLTKNCCEKNIDCPVFWSCCVLQNVPLLRLRAYHQHFSLGPRWEAVTQAQSFNLSVHGPWRLRQGSRSWIDLYKRWPLDNCFMTVKGRLALAIASAWDLAEAWRSARFWKQMLGCSVNFKMQSALIRAKQLEGQMMSQHDVLTRSKLDRN